VADADDRVVEGRCFPNTLGVHANQTLGPPTALRCSLAHARFNKALRFQPIQGGVNGADRTGASGCAFDFLPDRCSISIVAKARGLRSVTAIRIRRALELHSSANSRSVSKESYPNGKDEHRSTPDKDFELPFTPARNFFLRFLHPLTLSTPLRSGNGCYP